jgi:phage shock protein C
MKKLHKSSTDRVLTGVCGGLAEYFEVDSVLIRLIFIISIFIGGVGIFVYIILFFLMSKDVQEVVRKNIGPKAKTTNCPNCGTAIDGNFNYCPQCAVPLKKKCDKCGTICEANWQNCPNCGNTLNKENTTTEKNDFNI